MSIEEYESLKADEQFLKMIQDGHFLNHLILGSQSYSLYAIDNFFVEIEYNISDNLIINRTSFKTGDILNKHNSLNIEGIDVLQPEEDQNRVERQMTWLQNYMNVVNGRPYDSNELTKSEILLGQTHKYKKQIEVMEKSHISSKDQVSYLLNVEKKLQKEKIALWGIVILEFILILMLI